MEGKSLKISTQMLELGDEFERDIIRIIGVLEGQENKPYKEAAKISLLSQK